jgi:hypothetical protein
MLRHPVRARATEVSDLMSGAAATSEDERVLIINSLDGQHRIIGPSRNTWYSLQVVSLEYGREMLKVGGSCNRAIR